MTAGPLPDPREVREFVPEPNEPAMALLSEGNRRVIVHARDDLAAALAAKPPSSPEVAIRLARILQRVDALLSAETVPDELRWPRCTPATRLRCAVATTLAPCAP